MISMKAIFGFDGWHLKCDDLYVYRQYRVLPGKTLS